MEQNRIPPLLGKTLRRAIACLLVPLIFTAYAGSANAANQTTDVFSTMSTWLTTTGNAGSTLTLATTAGGQAVIDFHTTTPAIIIDGRNRTIQGWNTSGFATPIGATASGITSAGRTITLLDYTARVDALLSTLYTGINTLSTIRGAGLGLSTDRHFGGHLLGTGDQSKWFTTPGGVSTASDASGLNLHNIRFDYVSVRFGEYKFVNGLIGNHYNAGGPTSLGDITGNAFTRINVTLNSHNIYYSSIGGNPLNDPDAMYLAGGGIIGVRSTGDSGHGNNATATMGTVRGNVFDAINVITDNHEATKIWTPGMTGTEGSAYLEGGGLVGVNAASSPDVSGYTGHARMEELTNNLFTNIRILSNDILLGGGLVGLNNNSKRQEPGDTYALLPEASSNIFGDGTGTRGNTNGGDFSIRVEVGYSLRGGGVLGMNGLSSAEMRLENLENNAFAGIFVRTGSYLRGGGIVGLQTNDGDHKSGPLDLLPAMALLENASGNLFLNQRIDVGTSIHGGGVIGLRSNMGEAILGKEDWETNEHDESGLVGNVFRDIDVIVGNIEVSGYASERFLYGGGIVGVSGFRTATLARAEDNLFENLTVVVRRDITGDAKLYGGGFIGADAWTENDAAGVGSTATIGYVRNNVFRRGGVVAINVDADSIHGGGIIGATNDRGLAEIRNVTGNDFDSLKVRANSGDSATGNLVGGGVLGAWADAGNAEARIRFVENNVFRGMNVTTSGYLEGGGIIGVRSDNIAGIDTIRNNYFVGNTIEVGTYLDGGGIIGATGNKMGATWIREIDSSTFFENKVTTFAGDLFGGLVYSYGLDVPMTIRNSQFLSNTFSATGGIVYGAVTVDTGGATDYANSRPTHVMNLEATAGNLTVFHDNEITGGRADFGKLNSLFFGVTYMPGTSTIDYAQADARLNVFTQTDGVVALYDPIWVNQVNNGFANHTFHMNVAGSGHFIWGGENIFHTDGDTGTITLASGSTTTILDGTTRASNGTGFELRHGGAEFGYDVVGAERYTMRLIAPNHVFTLESANGNLDSARLNIEGQNFWDLSGNDDSAPVANLLGHMHFNLNNTELYRRGGFENPIDGTEVDDFNFNNALLTIRVPDNAVGMVDLRGSTVSLAPVTVATGRQLVDGDRFFLIEVINENTSGANALGESGYETFEAFVENASPITGTFLDPVRVFSGVTRSYNFIIDLNEDNDISNHPSSGPSISHESQTRFLVARIQDSNPDPGVWTPPPSTITFLHNDPPNIPAFADPRCDPCAPISCDPCAPRGMMGHPSQWVRTPFAEVGGTWYRLDTGSGSYSDVRGVQFQGGLAAQRRAHNGDGRVILGTFVDAGDGSYNAYDRVTVLSNPNLPEGYRSRGIMDYLGGGVLLRREWNNGFRFDAVFRGGSVKERYFSSDIAEFTAEDIPVDYRRRNAYWGTSLGLNHRTQLNQRSIFDMYSRYSWLMIEGGKVDITQHEDADLNEHAQFKAVHSHRLTSGARLTVQRHSRLSWYVGAAYQHEFDGRARAVITGEHHDPFVLGGSNIRGGTGVGELGLMMRPRDWFQLTTGLEGYTGKRDGGSVFATAVWRW